MYNVGETFRISYSSLSTLHSCGRKFEFAKLFQHSRNDESLPGEVGHALHDGFQSWVTFGDEEAAIWAMMKRYPIHLNSDPNNYRSLEACYATLQAMMHTDVMLEYTIAQIECLDGVVRPAIEVPFEIEIAGIYLDDAKKIPFVYTGFIDLLMYNELTGEYLVIDIKTHRQNLNDMTPQYRFSDQCLPYGIILERVLGHKLEGLTVKYFSVYVDIEKPTTKIYTFEVAGNEIQDWAKGLLVDLMNLRTFYSMGWFPRNGNSCQAFNKTCRHFDICAMRDHSAIQQIILMDKDPYVRREEAPWIKMQLGLAA